MPLTRQQKEDTVAALEHRFTDSAVALFLNFHKLSMKEGTAMRREMRALGLSYQVVKKTLLARAIAKRFQKDPPSLKGEIGVVFGNDSLAASKEVVRMVKAIKALTIQGGWSEGVFMEVRQIVALAMIPSRDALLGQLAMLLNAPVRNMVGALAAMPRQLVGTLEAIKNSKQ